VKKLAAELQEEVKKEHHIGQSGRFSDVFGKDLLNSRGDK
jgi:hypothetical protein